MVKIRLKLYLKMVIMLVCAIVGVGFVSGAEIVKFFSSFNNFSYIGIIIFFVLIFFLTNKILKNDNCNKNFCKMNNFDNIHLKNTFLHKVKIKSFLTKINVLLIASAMFSGFISLIKQLFFNNSYLVLIFVIIFVFLILVFGINGLQKFDYIVFVFLMLLTLYLCLFKNQSQIILHCSFSFKKLFSSVVFAVLYVFMNIIQIQPIVEELQVSFDKKGRLIFSFSFAVLLSLILLVFVKFLNNSPSLFKFDMPLVGHFKGKGVFYYFYIVGLFLALFSSLITCLMGVKSVCFKILKNNITASGFAIFLSIILSFIGFSNFVSFVYPLIGVINFIVFIFL